MKQLLQTLFFFLLVTQICFGQWNQQNSGTTKNLHAVQFIDANTGWAVGDSGTILNTTDMGNSWNIQTSGTMIPLNDICFTNDNYIWIVGGGYIERESVNIVLYTTNGGVEWIQLTVGDSLMLNAICFINESLGWIVGTSYKSSTGSTPIILKTTDGGNNWIYQSAPTGWGLNDVYFIDANIGFISAGGAWGEGCDGVILKTTNGGDNWIEQTKTSSIYWHGISFSDAQNGIVVGIKCNWFAQSGNIFRTTNGGTNWFSSYESGSSRFKSVTVMDSKYLWVVGSRILFSCDSGLNWTSQIDSGLYLNDLNSVYFINSSSGWVVGDDGTILHTTNSGVTFVEEEIIDELPTTFSLSNNYPNPFNPSTKIKYSVPRSSNVVIKIFDVLGTEIETLVNEEKPAGTYEITWNAANLPSRIYFYQLKAGEFVQMKKMILMK